MVYFKICYKIEVQINCIFQGLLHYHITNPNIPLSDIFGQMKAIKENYSIVEDYTISDTTLEQVFIAFAKKQAVLQQHN